MEEKDLTIDRLSPSELVRLMIFTVIKKINNTLIPKLVERHD